MDSCKTRGVVGAFVQENGIIRNKHGYIIGRLCEGVTIACVNEIGVKSEPKKNDSVGKKYLKVFLKAEAKDDDLYSGRSPEKFRDYLMDQHHLTVADVEICEEVKPDFTDMSKLLQSMSITETIKSYPDQFLKVMLEKTKEFEKLKSDFKRLVDFVSDIADCNDPEMGEVLSEYKKDAQKIITAGKEL